MAASQENTLAMSKNFPMGLQPADCISNLKHIRDNLPMGLLLDGGLTVGETLDRVEEMVCRFIPREPNGNHYQSMTCPTCGARIRSGQGSSSRVRDERCRRCGQAIFWDDNK